jgi:hypothetical protein
MPKTIPFYYAFIPKGTNKKKCLSKRLNQIEHIDLILVK